MKCLSMFLLTVLICCGCFVVEGRVIVVNDTEPQLSRAIRALSSALRFFQREYRNVNLDAVIGMRMVEDSFKVLLDNIDKSPQRSYVPEEHIEDIRQLKDLAGSVSDKAIPFVADSSPDYYKRIGALLGKGFWELNYTSRDIEGFVPIWNYNDEESMHEEESDDCLTELFGTGKNSKEPCRITDKCWALMTAPGYSGYSLSHEIFYLEIGEMFGCSPEVMWKTLTHQQPSLAKMRETFCANMLSEAKLIADNNFPPRKQDLFMEQGALCGMLGYRQFFNSDWLEMILGWQDPATGCFLATPKDDLDHEDEHFKRNRVKREEKRLADGCLCHRTTVAAAALSQYIRYIIEAGMLGSVQPAATMVELDGENLQEDNTVS